MPISQWPLPRRRDLIRRLRESGSQSHHHQMIFQGGLQTFAVYTVEIGFPCYRLANGRTQSRQRELIAVENLEDDFFSADPDSAAALKKQDAILRDIVVNTELLSILKRDPQTQPLILDTDGYVINGNRRLCAMRMLLDEDEQAYSRFRSVQVVLLPPCSESDIVDLEARLQIVPEGRENCTWIDEAMMFRRGREQGWTDERLSQIYDKSPVEIRQAIAMLDDAEQYLADRGLTNHYSMVSKKEYAFRELQKHRRKCNDDEARKQFFTSVSYVMLDDPEAAGKRLYERIPDAFRHLDALSNAILEELAAPAGGISSIEGDDGIELLGTDASGSLTDATERLRDPLNRAKARDVVRDTLEEMLDLERERRDAQFCARCVQNAHAKLQSALSALDASTDTEGIAQSLEGIEQAVAEMRAWLIEHSSN